jgi:hypothetical protein
MLCASINKIQRQNRQLISNNQELWQVFKYLSF